MKKAVKRYPKFVLPLAIIVLVILVLFIKNSKESAPTLIQDIIRSEQSAPGMHSYRAVPPYTFNVKEAAKLIPHLTDMVITPDNTYILAATLEGKVFALKIKEDGSLEKQERPFFETNISPVGYPNIEIGLTGIALGADFETSGDVFILYSYDEGNEGESLLKNKFYKSRVFENRITRVHWNPTVTGVYGNQAEIIFKGATLTSQAHQIERAVGVMVQNKPHLLFTIGDGYEATQALSLDAEAGKMFLIQRDGSAPLGKRPYPEQPLIQAIGIRNGSSISYDSATGKVLFSDTSNENFDRLIYGKVFDPKGLEAHPYSFLWNGDDMSLFEKVKNPYDLMRDPVLYRWSPSETPVDSLVQGDTFYVITFGETKSPRTKPGKRILIGNKKADGTVAFSGLVERDPGAYGFLGNPISVVINSKTNNMYFADFEEGKIFTFKLPN